MHVVARLRNVLARHPWLYWAAVVFVAGGAATLLAAAGAAVDDARRAWGETRAVVVATADLAPGDQLADATEVRSLPLPMIPAGALDAVGPGAAARQQVTAGEVVVSVDVAASAAPQALIPARWSAIAVAEPVPAGVVTGNAVRVVAQGVVVAAEGLVVGHSGDAVLVAVPDDEAPAVAMAATSGELSLLLVP